MLSAESLPIVPTSSSQDFNGRHSVTLTFDPHDLGYLFSTAYSRSEYLRPVSFTGL